MFNHPSNPITQHLLLQRFVLLRQQAVLQAQKGADLKGSQRPTKAPKSVLPFTGHFSWPDLTVQQWLVLAAGGALALWHAHYWYVKHRDNKQSRAVPSSKIELPKAQIAQHTQPSAALSGALQPGPSRPTQ